MTVLGVPPGTSIQAADTTAHNLGASIVRQVSATQIETEPDIDPAAFAAALPAADLDRTRTDKRAEATSYYESLMQAGFTYLGVRYQIDAYSQFRMAAIGGIASWRPNSFPAGFAWIAADNSRVTMDEDAMMDLAGTIANYESTCRMHLRDLKDQIDAAADTAAVQAIDVTAGYPPASA